MKKEDYDNSSYLIGHKQRMGESTEPLPIFIGIEFNIKTQTLIYPNSHTIPGKLYSSQVQFSTV